MTVTLQPVDLTVNDKLKAALRAALSDQRGNCLAEAVPMLPKCAQQESVESFKTRIDVVQDAMHRLHRSNISLMRAAYEKTIDDDLVPRLAAAAQGNMDYPPPQEVEPDASIPLELMIERHKKHFELRKQHSLPMVKRAIKAMYKRPWRAMAGLVRRCV